MRLVCNRMNMMRTAIVCITVSASVNQSPDIAYEYGVRVEDILRENTITNVLLVEQGVNLKIPKK